jgi:hypothetical protein
MYWGKDHRLYCKHFPDDIYFDFQLLKPFLKKMCGKYFLFTEKYNKKEVYQKAGETYGFKASLIKRYNAPEPTFPTDYTEDGDEMDINWCLSHAKIYVMHGGISKHGTGGTRAIWFIPKTEVEKSNYINTHKPEHIVKFEDRKQVIKNILPSL